MALVRTTTAHCDEVGCDGKQALSSQATQPFRDLTGLGWSIVTTFDGIETYCPFHAEFHPA
jgi:hypothetical protein